MKPFMLAFVVGVLATGCGDKENGSSPAAPSPTTSSITVTVDSPLRIGRTTQARAVATLSNGQTETLTSGFQSDAPSVASVTAAGAVTGVSNGRATIFLVANGRQGQQNIRVLPDYEGRWSGGLRILTCIESGIIAETDFCKTFAVGDTYGFRLALQESGESISGTADYGDDFVFPPISAGIGADGSAAFTSTFVSDEAILAIETSWRINSPTAGSLTGTVDEVWRVPGFSGEGRLHQDIVGASRTSGAAATRGSDRLTTLRTLERLIRSDR